MAPPGDLQSLNYEARLYERLFLQIVHFEERGAHIFTGKTFQIFCRVWMGLDMISL